MSYRAYYTAMAVACESQAETFRLYAAAARLQPHIHEQSPQQYETDAAEFLEYAAGYRRLCDKGAP